MIFEMFTKADKIPETNNQMFQYIPKSANLRGTHKDLFPACQEVP